MKDRKSLKFSALWCPAFKWYDIPHKVSHIYTFENICKEDGSIFMGDEAVKIFLNAKGTLDDVSDKYSAPYHTQVRK